MVAQLHFHDCRGLARLSPRAENTMAENVMADENATTEIASRGGAVSLIGDGRGQHRIRVFYDGRRFLL